MIELSFLTRLLNRTKRSLGMSVAPRQRWDIVKVEIGADSIIILSRDGSECKFARRNIQEMFFWSVKGDASKDDLWVWLKPAGTRTSYEEVYAGTLDAKGQVRRTTSERLKESCLMG